MAGGKRYPSSNRPGNEPPTKRKAVLPMRDGPSLKEERSEDKKHSVFDSSFPVLLPSMDALHFSEPDFDEYIASILPKSKKVAPANDDTSTNEGGTGQKDELNSGDGSTKDQPFMSALLSHESRSMTESQLASENKMLTENLDVAYASTDSPIVDLFFELETSISADRLQTLLQQAWEEDASATLKIIFNARSIHLGKSNREITYRCIAWLAKKHPKTLLANLKWFVEPLIPKKAPKEEEEKNESDSQKAQKKSEEDFAFVDVKEIDNVDAREGKEEQDESYLVKHGGAHGYWKDLLNILSLAANDELTVDGDQKRIFNITPQSKKNRTWDEEEARQNRHTVQADRHKRVLQKLENDKFYLALHLTVARLFANQLKADKECLQSGDKEAQRKISLAAKWAPSFGNFHDKHTFIASSIAEILYPQANSKMDSMDRETYLKVARQYCRNETLSPLRKFLEIVERDISAKSFGKIKYDRVPSLAMDRYQKLFAKKDFDRFDKYIEKVAQGKSRISGAILLPANLIQKARMAGRRIHQPKAESLSAEASVKAKLLEMESKTLDGQWKTLVQRIKDSGSLESSIAVCDVSGSMSGPTFNDGTCPMDSAVGLSLLLAEVVDPPFGGAFITFSNRPAVHKIDLNQGLSQKVSEMEDADWGMNTDFEAVFLKLLLPIALEHKLKPEDMVKQVFVFSDMHFDHASGSCGRWSTSFERIKEKYSNAGYELPELIFWNLAGGRSGGTAPKPVTSDEPGTALVSGYSQGQMKMFLDNGQFEEPEEEEEITEKEEEEEGDEDDDKEGLVGIEKRKLKKKTTPLDTVKKAISHNAYSMLEVMD